MKTNKGNPLHRAHVGAAISRAVSDAFRGRKGHGGGRCTRRVLRPEGLRDFGKNVLRHLEAIADSVDEGWITGRVPR